MEQLTGLVYRVKNRVGSPDAFRQNYKSHLNFITLLRERGKTEDVKDYELEIFKKKTVGLFS